MARSQSVDIFRVLGILAVIGLHVSQQTDPAGLGRRLDIATLFDQLERFAVPMFFTLSGYFWASKCETASDCWPRALALARRVLLLFACWCLVYALASIADAAVRHGSLVRAIDIVAARHSGPLTLLLQGTKVHLWFLPALASAALISGACLAGRRSSSFGWGLLAVLATLLFLAGLAGKAYAPALGLAPRFNFRNGPFFSLALFAAGAALSRLRPVPAWLARGALVAGAGLALQLCETLWLQRRWGASLVQDYVVGTFLFGLGAAMMALSGTSALRSPRLAAIGPLVLGIYASHYLFIDLLYPLDGLLRGHPGWRVAYVALVFACALALSRLLARHAWTRHLVN
jgi:surface polysaccharide O-acyltransferase-like enzyme